jgi:hypothetical protein
VPVCILNSNLYYELIYSLYSIASICAYIIVKGSMCSVCVILLFAEPLFPGYAPGYYVRSGCICLNPIFTVEGGCIHLIFLGQFYSIINCR